MIALPDATAFTLLTLVPRRIAVDANWPTVHVQKYRDRLFGNGVLLLHRWDREPRQQSIGRNLSVSSGPTFQVDAREKMVVTMKLNAAHVIEPVHSLDFTAHQPSALHTKPTKLRNANTWRAKANRQFDMRCHRIPFFDVVCGYFWPCIGQLANWTKLVMYRELVDVM